MLCIVSLRADWETRGRVPWCECMVSGPFIVVVYLSPVGFWGYLLSDNVYLNGPPGNNVVTNALPCGV